jgi:hypothetical protein
VRFRRAGLVVVLVQAALAAGLFFKLEREQRLLPTVWVKVVEYTPSESFRGQRIWLTLEVTPADGRYPEPDPDEQPFPRRLNPRRRPPSRATRLFVRGNRLMADVSRNAFGYYVVARTRPDGGVRLVLPRVVSVFVPKDAPEPPRPESADELLVEVGVSESAPPRPLRLAIRRDGVLTVFAGE